MPFNGSGTFTVYTPGNPIANGDTSNAVYFNNTMTDFATGLSNTMTKDGQGVPTANIPMGNNKLTGLANGTISTDAAAYGQVTAAITTAAAAAQNGSQTYLTSVSGTNTITATLTGLTAYTAGLTVRFTAAGANTGAVTLNIGSLGAINLVRADGVALVTGDILSAGTYEAVYDGTSFKLQGSVAASQIAGFSAPIPIPVRQTVLSGPVDSSGFSAFGGSTGSATVTAAGTLVSAAANGFGSSGQVDRIGSIVNPSWAGLSTNGTMYLYLDIASNGTCTTGSTTLAPTYQWGGAYSTTNNQFTFNIQEMVGKVGNGATSAQTYRVFVGEVTVAGGVVAAIVWYALMGRYTSATTNTLPAANTQTSFNHNIGVIPKRTNLIITCITAQSGYVAGEQVGQVSTVDTVGGSNPYSSLRATRNVMSISTSDNQAFRTNPTAGGVGVALTAANFSYRAEAERGW
jgi:hypothetical protein